MTIGVIGHGRVIYRVSRRPSARCSWTPVVTSRRGRDGHHTRPAPLRRTDIWLETAANCSEPHPHSEDRSLAARISAAMQTNVRDSDRSTLKPFSGFGFRV